MKVTCSFFNLNLQRNSNSGVTVPGKSGFGFGDDAWMKLSTNPIAENT